MQVHKVLYKNYIANWPHIYYANTMRNVIVRLATSILFLLFGLFMLILAFKSALALPFIIAALISLGLGGIFLFLTKKAKDVLEQPAQAPTPESHAEKSAEKMQSLLQRQNQIVASWRKTATLRDELHLLKVSSEKMADKSA